jgi:hypothetical protein
MGNQQPPLIVTVLQQLGAIATRARAYLAKVLPDPARTTQCSAGGDFFFPSETASVAALAAQRALEQNMPLVVIVYSPLHPDAAALMADLERCATHMLDTSRLFITSSVDVTASGQYGEVPAALYNAVALPAVGVYTPTSRNGGEMALLAVAEGVTRATTIAALLSECLTRMGRGEILQT